jgi:hypothetical protein
MAKIEMAGLQPFTSAPVRFHGGMEIAVQFAPLWMKTADPVGMRGSVGDE